MRHLIILIGPKDSGKTDFVKRLGLSAWHIDQSAIDRLSSSITMNEDGEIITSSAGKRRGGDLVLSTLRTKMERSEFIVFEPSDDLASGERRSSITISDLLICAEKNGYRTTFVNFGSSSEFQDSLARLLQQGMGSAITHTTPDAFSSALDEIKNPTVDISHVDAIVAIGDVHGNAQALETCLSQAHGRGKIAFVFTGDFINKGPHPARTLRLLSDFKQNNSDCFLLYGNHEMMLENWAWRRASNREVFSSDTLPDFHANQYTRREARAFLTHLTDHVRLTWRGYDIMVTHGGLSAPPKDPGLLPGHVKRLGVGQPSADIDRFWERNSSNPRSIQIHGHRNLYQIGIEEAGRSFNLEGIDAFGKMRGMVIRSNGADIKAQGFSIPIAASTRRRKKRCA